MLIESPISIRPDSAKNSTPITDLIFSFVNDKAKKPIVLTVFTYVTLTKEIKGKGIDSFLSSYTTLSIYKSPLKVRICFVRVALVETKELDDGSYLSSLHTLHFGEAMRDFAIDVSTLSWILFFDSPRYKVMK